jgi:hypothetical protein
MRLTAPAIRATDVITAQALYDMWVNSTVVAGSIEPTDLVTTGVEVSASAPTAEAGKIWFDTVEDLWKIFAPMIDGTGASLWLSIGADRKDDAFIAAQPIPPRAVVGLKRNAAPRSIRPCPDPCHPVIGVSLNDTTAASGSWVAVCVEGICDVRVAFPLTAHASVSHGTQPVGAGAHLVVDGSGEGKVQTLNTVANNYNVFSPGIGIGRAIQGAADCRIRMVVIPGGRICSFDNARFTTP